MNDWRKEKVDQRIWELNKPGNELGSPPWVSEVMALSHYARPPSTRMSCVRCVWVWISPLAQAPGGYMKSYTTFVRLLTHQTCNICLAQIKWVSLVSTEPSQVWGSRGCSGGITGGWYLEGGFKIDRSRSKSSVWTADRAIKANRANTYFNTFK